MSVEQQLFELKTRLDTIIELLTPKPPFMGAIEAEAYAKRAEQARESRPEKVEHSPLPWLPANCCKTINDAGGAAIVFAGPDGECEVRDERIIENNVRLIVEAVNKHQDLRQLLGSALALHQWLSNRAESVYGVPDFKEVMGKWNITMRPALLACQKDVRP